MAEHSILHAVTQLRNPTNPESQIAALKHLKNESIGHTEKKEELIRHGVIDALGQTLINATKSRGKRRDQQAHVSPGPQSKHGWEEEDEIRLQAILLLSSIAHGGPAFVAPIVAGSIIQILVAALSPSENHSNIIAACLKTLLYLAESSRNASPRSESLQKPPSIDILYSKNTMRVFAEILAQRLQSSSVQTQISYLCQLIDKTCLEEHQRDALTAGGILDLLGARLASYHAHQRFFPVRLPPSLFSTLPPPPSRQILPYILATLTCISHNAKYRIARLLCSPPILNVFPFHRPEAMGDPSSSMGGQSNGAFVSPIEFGLPQVQRNHPRGENDRAFPALGSAQTSIQNNGIMDLMDNGSASSDHGAESMIGSNGSESSLVSWLLHTIRSEQGLCRLHAADLLVTMNLAGFLTKSRDRLMAVLVLPLLLSMMDKSSTHNMAPGSHVAEIEARTIKEQAPIILRKAILKNSELQKAAVDVGALTKASQLLKQSFEPLESRPPLWFPNDPSTFNGTNVPASSKLGPGGLRADLVHLLHCRIGALRLLAAIADKEDKYRKQLTESGAVTYVIESLMPFNEDALAELDSGYANGKVKIQPSALGNSIDVLLAACDAALALSRSVGLLRTSLIDAGLSKPMYSLLRHPSVSVVRAATDVICNIILEFSPMREDLVDAGVIKTLCEHAHSADSSLRLVSLWALKHLMTKLPMDTRLLCFEELGAGWLMQIITGGPNSSRTSKSSQPLAMGAANAAGERIDILNAVDEPMDTAEDGVTSETLPSSNTASDDTNLISTAVLRSLLPIDEPEFTLLASTYRTRLNALKMAEDRDVASQVYADELKIQAQGLDFIRNMASPPGAGDMIDTIFATLGASNVFEMVSNKLKWPPSHLTRYFTSAAANGNSNGTAASAGSSAGLNLSDPPPSANDLEAATRLLESAVQVLVHIAAGAPRHRQQLISQTALLKTLVPLSAHPDSAVRVAVVWTAINLTWVDDASDALGARQRALELRKLGFEDVLKGLEATDLVKDVKERAHTAVEQMVTLIENGVSGRHR